jgi:hypothetical protein
MFQAVKLNQNEKKKKMKKKNITKKKLPSTRVSPQATPLACLIAHIG